MTGQPIESLDTPRLLVDADRLERNIRTFHDSIPAAVHIRPHVKTHKSVDIARLQMEAGAIGVAAAKVSEAAVFVDAGIRDVTIAYPIFGLHKWQRVAALAAACDRLVVHVENAAAVAGLSAAATAAGTEIGVRIEIDSGFHRSGVDSKGAVDLATVISAAPGLYLDGITSHRSMFFPDAGGRDPYELGVEEGELMVRIAEDLRAVGVVVQNVVAGSTPTGPGVATVEGVTEICAGTYVFYDAGMAALGVVDSDRVSLSVAATVVVAHEKAATYTVDAGAKTFTKDRYPGQNAGTFGVGLDRPDTLVAVTDEHGIVATDGPMPGLGEVLRFYPMHVCPTVNLADELVVVRDGIVEECWPVSARGANR